MHGAIRVNTCGFDFERSIFIEVLYCHDAARCMSVPFRWLPRVIRVRRQHLLRPSDLPVYLMVRLYWVSCFSNRGIREEASIMLNWGECLLPFSSESSFFLSAIWKLRDQACKSQRWLCVPHGFITLKLCILLTQCICVFHIVLTTNSDWLRKQH
jgi:hypothetical protein